MVEVEDKASALSPEEAHDQYMNTAAAYVSGAIAGTEYGLALGMTSLATSEVIKAGGFEKVAQFATEIATKVASNVDINTLIDAAKTALHHPNETTALMAATSALIAIGGGTVATYLSQYFAEKVDGKEN